MAIPNPRVLVAIAAAVPAAFGLVVTWEGQESLPYRDVGGVWTVCAGVTGPWIVPGRFYSRKECEALTRGALDDHARGLASCLTTTATQPALAAWLSWTYNVGVGAACGSTLVRLANAGRIEAACNELLRWDRVKGSVVRGLSRRRAAEWAWCMEGLR